MNDKSSSPVGIGVISIITVLLVLCLTIFSALTLTSAKADLALSEKNADTVSAYYRADSQAASLYDAFAAGSDIELETSVPMTESQSLYLHLQRNEDGAVQVLAWRTQPVEEEGMEFDDTLPVWDGTLPDG